MPSHHCVAVILVLKVTALVTEESAGQRSITSKMFKLYLIFKTFQLDFFPIQVYLNAEAHQLQGICA